MCLSFRFCFGYLLSVGLAGLAHGQQFMLPPAERVLIQPPGFNLLASFMAEDQQGHLWLTSPSGLVRCDRRQLDLFHADDQRQDDIYERVAPDQHGRIWLRYNYGDDESRLAYFDQRIQRIVFVSDTTRLVREFLRKDGIRSLFVDRQGQLWIGRKEQGLLRVNPNTLAAEAVFSEKAQVVDMAEGPDGLLWLATKSGLYRLDPHTRQIRHYTRDARLPNSLGADTITAVQVRANGDVLLGLTNELNILSPASGQVRRIRWPLPTPTSVMWTNKIISDRQGNAYLSVGLMVFRLSPQNELQRIEFANPSEKIISLCISHENRLWVNAGRRLYAYDLSRLRPVPPLNLLDVTVNGTRLIQNEQQSEERFLRDASGQPRIFLKEGDFVQLRFTPYAEARTSRFRYKLEGFDQQWTSYLDELGVATFQPPAGTYSFVLNRAKANGGWNTQLARVQIEVEPPFWKQTWFLLLLLTTVGGVLYVLIRSQNRRQHLQQELARQAFEAATLREVDKVKSEFFANVTHEFRTPLTIILNATEQLTGSSLTAEQQHQADMIQRHAHQLLGLITETLDMARVDAGKLEPHDQLGDPMTFIGQVVAQFQGLARQRSIELVWKPDEPANDIQGDSSPELLYSFDSDKWEKVVYNLLSNALKFTPEHGSVCVTGRIQEDRFVLQVADTGIGIPAQQLTRIFERFHQVDASSTRAYSGTGIGLALVKELTDWLGGRIQVASELGQGSVFTVELPLKPASTVGSEPIEQKLPSSQLHSEPTAQPKQILSATDEHRTSADGEPAEKMLVLVVEDNADLRMQLANYLSSQYRVQTASTGRQALVQSLAQVPDLIVSDVMMAEMDGYELVERLKADERTSHIPLVLLTARTSADSRMKGLQVGADEYLTKPFSLAELTLRIGNSLRTRQNWQQRFMAKPIPAATASLPKPAMDREERFLNRLRQAILEHLDESQTLDVDWLAAQANMSRIQLHRKLTALTSLSPNRFIHRVRLEHAACLLEKGELNVAQVAYEVGYSSQSYFAKVFQEHFGYAPAKLKGIR